MRNLAGDERCDASIRDELEAAGIEIVAGEPTNSEVAGCLTGKLGAFTFRRAWYYWVACGAVPLAIAEELYADPIGRKDVRVAGHCGCPPPADWADHFDTDGKQLLAIDSNDYRFVTAPRPDGPMGPIWDEMRSSYRFVDDPKSSACAVDRRWLPHRFRGRAEALRGRGTWSRRRLMTRCTANHQSGRRCLLVSDHDGPHCTTGEKGWHFFGRVRCERCHREVDVEVDTECHAHDCDGAA